MHAWAGATLEMRLDTRLLGDGRTIPDATVYASLEAGAVNQAAKLDPAQQRIIDASLKAMKLSGVALTGDAKDKFNANRMELADLSTKFSNHVLDATKAFSLVLTDKADVEGLPPSAAAPSLPPKMVPCSSRRLSSLPEASKSAAVCCLPPVMPPRQSESVRVRSMIASISASVGGALVSSEAKQQLAPKRSIDIISLLESSSISSACADEPRLTI